MLQGSIRKSCSDLDNRSILVEYIARIHPRLHILQIHTHTVRQNRPAQPLELTQIIHHTAPEKRTAVLKRRLIDDHRRTLRQIGRAHV